MAKCVLLYRPPHGGAPTQADAEVLVSALQRVCGVAAGGSAGAGADGRAQQPERQLEARCTRMAQAPARDASVVAQPVSLADIWLLQLPGEAPDRAFICNQLSAHARKTRLCSGGAGGGGDGRQRCPRSLLPDAALTEIPPLHLTPSLTTPLHPPPTRHR